jgi:hypothetical protein
MQETGNIFDASTTLMEIEEPPPSQADPALEVRPATGEEDEPDYFTPPGSRSQAEVRRRGLSLLGVVGGMGFTVVLVSAATGFGQGPSAKAPESVPSPTHPMVAASTAPPKVVPPAPRPGPKPTSKSHASTPKSVRHRSAHRRSKPPAPGRHHRHASSSSAAAASSPESEPAYVPEPEPTYAPEPEATYVPAETAPPAPVPSSSPPSSGGSPSEFGIER